jgi:hypothetical protein
MVVKMIILPLTNQFTQLAETAGIGDREPQRAGDDDEHSSFGILSTRHSVLENWKGPFSLVALGMACSQRKSLRK